MRKEQKLRTMYFLFFRDMVEQIFGRIFSAFSAFFLSLSVFISL